MANGIDWFRWHHGSVTDPKFALIAKKSGARLGDVLAVWAYVLERASASDERGTFGEIDCEAVDCMLGMNDGQCASIYAAMSGRGLVSDGKVCAWEKRQPKRERDDDNSTARVQAFRERQRQQATGNATERHGTPVKRHETPREEKSREEEIHNPPTPSGVAPPKVRGSKRCPESFAIDADTARSMRDECPGVDIDAETRKFRDHTFATARTDWLATWRNWIRGAAERIPQARASPQRATAAALAMAAANPSIAAPHLRQPRFEVFDVTARQVD